MIELVKNGVYLLRGEVILEDAGDVTTEKIQAALANRGLPPLTKADPDPEAARTSTMSYGILTSHNFSGDAGSLKIRFDALASHDITYVGIIQTARASGLERFPVPYVLTNCHNSLCAVGGTINEDDHVFGLSAAKKYGGIFVPAHQAVIHQYVREVMTGCGRMILGSDSHTRYGALGVMGVGEGGPELVKQLLARTYDVDYPEVIAVYLDGRPAEGVGPQDVALALIGAVFENGFVKNKVLEFVGPGISNLSVDFRNGIDVMTTETACLTSIWTTDDRVAEYYRNHGRPEDYRRLEPGEAAYYDGLVKIDLNSVIPMIALPFHPSNVYPIEELNRHAVEILREVEEKGRKQLETPGITFNLTDKVVNGRLKFDQGVVAGCAGGTYENISAMGGILDQASIGNGDFGLSVYPASQPIFLELLAGGAVEKLIQAGAVIRSAFCGPCFGAGDVPAHGAISARHSTRNFPNREGSKPGSGQLASVALMDARSIAATAANGGVLTPAAEVRQPSAGKAYVFHPEVYANRVYNGFGKPHPELALKFGPNIVDWPKMHPLPENLLLSVASVIRDPVTTTDELIPSGETSSYRSNPLKLAEFTLSRKDPGYVERAKYIQGLEVSRRKWLEEGKGAVPSGLESALKVLAQASGRREAVAVLAETGLGTVIYAVKPGDGSAREQAASCQKVLGGWANLAREYATKRYRSNLVNWGLIPFTIDTGDETISVNDFIFFPGIRKAVGEGADVIEAIMASPAGKKGITVNMPGLTRDERDILLAGSLINYYAK
ncbi:MAG: hydratase [Bacillota bacterium]